MDLVTFIGRQDHIKIFFNSAHGYVTTKAMQQP